MEGINNDTLNDTVTTIIQAAAATTTMGTTPTVNPAVNAEIAATINQLSANQITIMLHMVALLFALAPAQLTCRFVPRNAIQVPPSQQVAIPMQQTFLAGDFNAGHGGHCCGPGRGLERGRYSRTSFADYMRTIGAVPNVPGHIIPYGGRIPQIPSPPVVQQQTRNPVFSNVYKWYNNWNVCFLCGFNVGNGHMSLTCPFKKLNHQQSYTQENVQQFIAACT
jgi:hypothetical protein